MKYPMYSIRDNKVCFGAPFIEQNDASAVRGFSQAINSGNGTMNYCPADFDLFKVAEFDADSGIVEAVPVPVLIVSGNSVFGA